MSLQTEITTRADCADALAARDLDALARIVSQGRVSTQSRFVTARTILGEIAGGAALLEKMVSIGSTQPAVKYAMTFLNQDSGLDIGHPATQGMVDQLVAGTLLTAAEGVALKGLASRPETITRQQVEEAVFFPNGTRKP